MLRAPDAAQHEVMRCGAGAHRFRCEVWIPALQRTAEVALRRVRDKDRGLQFRRPLSGSGHDNRIALGRQHHGQSAGLGQQPRVIGLHRMGIDALGRT